MNEIGRGLAHYKGVALAALGIVLASIILPGPEVIGGQREVAQSQGTAATSDVVETTAPAPAPEAFEGVLAPSTQVIDDQPARATTFSPGSFTSEPSSSSDDVASDRDSASSDAGTSDTTITTLPRRSPLKIRVAAWSSRTAGTPLAAQDVPEKTLPVGKRLGQDDKVSFVKLQGTDTTLRLKVGDAAGQRTPESAVIYACPIAGSAWTEGDAMSMDADPEYDCAKQVEGKANGNEWIFDLASFGASSITSDRGFALVPGGDGLADFQVAFTRD
jgi:hypothetical protein